MEALNQCIKKLGKQILQLGAKISTNLIMNTDNDIYSPSLMAHWNKILILYKQQ